MSRPHDYQPGEKHRGAKLTEADAIDALRRIKGGETYKSIAKSKGVALGTIGKIAAGVNWKFIDRSKI